MILINGQLQIAVDKFCAQYEQTQDFTNNNNEDNFNNIDNEQPFQDEIDNNYYNNNTDIPNNIEANIEVKEVIEPSNNSNNTTNNNINNELIYIKCMRIGETELLKTSDVSITVSFPEIVESGFFSSKNVIYLISTSI